MNPPKTPEEYKDCERLAHLALHLIGEPRPRDNALLEKAFIDALPIAFRLLELTKEFMKQKEAERTATGKLRRAKRYVRKTKRGRGREWKKWQKSYERRQK